MIINSIDTVSDMIEALRLYSPDAKIRAFDGQKENALFGWIDIHHGSLTHTDEEMAVICIGSSESVPGRFTEDKLNGPMTKP